MTARQHKSKERFYRYMSIALGVATAVLLVPPDWIPLVSARPKPLEPEARVIEIVRLPPDTLPPPPPLPEPEPKPEPEPEPEPVPEPEPELELVRFEQVVPEIDIPEEREFEKRVELQADQTKQLTFDENVPSVDLPREELERQKRRVEIAASDSPRLKRNEQQVDVSVPRNVPRQKDRKQVQVAAMTSQSYQDKDAPDLRVATARPATRASDRPSPLPPSQQLRSGVSVQVAENAPAVDVPRGNTTKANQKSAVAVSGAFTGSQVVYDAKPGNAPEVAVATPKEVTAGGAAPRLAVEGGSSSGVNYSAAPADTPDKGGGARTTSGPTRLEGVRANLARKYGLPLVSVNDLGQRSTEAARWNVLLPQLSDLLRVSRGLGGWKGGSEVKSVERDGRSVIIRYHDGIVHVLVPDENGLAMLFVARGKGARPVVSKVEEAESARRALSRYTRGAS